MDVTSAPFIFMMFVSMTTANGSSVASEEACHVKLSVAVQCQPISAHQQVVVRLVEKAMEEPWLLANQGTGRRHMICTLPGFFSTRQQDNATHATTDITATRATNSVSDTHAAISATTYLTTSKSNPPSTNAAASNAGTAPQVPASSTVWMARTGPSALATPQSASLPRESASVESVGFDVATTSHSEAPISVTTTGYATTTGDATTAGVGAACTWTTRGGGGDGIIFPFPPFASLPILVDFSVKSDKNAKIVFAQTSANASEQLNFYELTVGTLFEQSRATFYSCKLAGGGVCKQLDKQNGYSLSVTAFRRFWVMCESNGRIRLGRHGEPADLDIVDPDPIPNIRHVGFYNKVTPTEWIFHDGC